MPGARTAEQQRAATVQALLPPVPPRTTPEDPEGLARAMAAAGLQGQRTADIELPPEPVPLEELLRRAQAMAPPIQAPPPDLARQALIAKMGGASGGGR